MAYQESDVYALVLGRTIAQLRDRQSWTQADLADRLGVAQSSMSRFEKGQVQPDPYQLRKIAEVFHLEEATFIQLVSDAMTRTENAARHAGLPGT